MSKQTGVRAWLLKRWIKSKMKWSGLKRDPEKELFMMAIIFKDFKTVPTMKDLEAMGIRYRSEFLLSVIPWDYQYSAVEVLKRGFADCNSLNRVIQCVAIVKGMLAYLVTYWPDTGVREAHTTVIIRTPSGRWRPCDYGYLEDVVFKDPDDCVDHIAQQYNTGVSAYVAQDWKWKFKTLK